MAWDHNIYTVDYGNGQWMIAKFRKKDGLGYHFEDSRGNQTILPAHTVHKLTKRSGW